MFAFFIAGIVWGILIYSVVLYRFYTVHRKHPYRWSRTKGCGISISASDSDQAVWILQFANDHEDDCEGVKDVS